MRPPTDLKPLTKNETTGDGKEPTLEAAFDFLLENPNVLEPGAPAVQRIETHISLVFLTENFVFKFKKPVKFPFIDQSTRRQRLENCLHEIRLNRRLASDVYLGIRSLFWDGRVARLGPQQAEPESLSVGRGGLAVAESQGEPCVVMKRLAAESTLAEHVRHGRADFGMMEKVGALLAEFHARADRLSPGISQRDFRRSFLENLDVADELPEFRQLGLRQRLLAALERAWPLIRRRERLGRIVDGHGDLRLEHIYVDPGSVRIIDCVEFSPSLRAVDPYEDLAFTSMALSFEGRPDLAHRLVAAYAGASADLRGLELLPLFELYRMAVRIKVDLLTIRGNPGSEARLRPRVERYVQMCHAKLNTSVELPVPRLLVVVGLPATGKSTRALELARQHQAVTVSTDVVRKRTLGISISRKKDVGAFSEIYTARETARNYRRVVTLASAGLRLGWSIVVDGTFSRRTQRNQLRKMAQRHGIEAEFYLVTASEQEIRKRLEKRKQQATTGASELTSMETWLLLRDAWEPFDSDEGQPHPER